MKSIATIVLVTLFISCGQAQKSPHDQANIHKFIVEEVLQTKSYTYLLANENGKMQWLAMPSMQAVVGEVYYYTQGPEMRNFKSTELDRTFESVLFLQGVQSAKTIQPSNNESKNVVIATDNQKIEQAAGGITVAKLMANMEDHEGKIVKVRGRVVKFNADIMGKNWIHLQDGTGDDGENDLTVTTDMAAEVGKVITIEGIITLNKDFGAGYFYKIIMEEGKVIE